MAFIASVWWLWGILLLGSVIFLGRKMFGHINNPGSMLGADDGMKSTFMSFIPVWGFGLLFFLSIVLNVISFAQGG